MLTLNKVNYPQAKTEYMIRMRSFKGLNLSCDRGLVELEESPEAFNVDTSGGSLKRSKGFGKACFEYKGVEKPVAALPCPIVKLFVLREGGKTGMDFENLYFSGTDGRLYRFIYNDGDDCFDANIVDNDVSASGVFTYFTQYKFNSLDRALLGGEACEPRLYEVSEGVYSSLTGGNLPKMKRTAVHYARTFGVGDKAHPQRIWFSALYSHCNFEISEEEGGYIDITDNIGDTIEVISFFDTLYVFCRYGIVALNTLSQQKDYSLENVYYSDSEIISGSICVCGKNIFFATRSGIYAFNGINVVCVSEKIRNFFEQNALSANGACCAWYKNSYVVSYFSHTSSQGGMLIYDTVRNSWQILKDVYVNALVVLPDNENEKLIAAIEGEDQLYVWGAGDSVGFDNKISALWKSPKNDFGLPATKKFFKELHFVASGTGEIEITLFCDGKEEKKSVTLLPEERAYGVRLDCSGVCVGFEITNKSGCDFNILPITFIYTAEREYAK